MMVIYDEYGTHIIIISALQQVDGYTPGVDYPIYNSVPFGLTFTCGGKLPGYYADPEARCQVRPYGRRMHRSRFNIFEII